MSHISSATVDPAIDAIAREHYDRCHRDDSFADLVQRARFSKDDRGRLAQWRDYARALLSARNRTPDQQQHQQQQCLGETGEPASV